MFSYIEFYTIYYQPKREGWASLWNAC